MHSIAYLPVEIRQRDLDARILIAAHLLHAGVSVVIGQQWGVFGNIKKFPPGIALFKTVNQLQAAAMAAFHDKGHLVAATDEEVLDCVEDACFLESFSQTAADHCHLFLAQNEPHKTAVERRFPALSGRISVVGNSRVDMLSPKHRPVVESEAQSEAMAHRPYILFNTNFGQINSIWRKPSYVMAIAEKVGWVDPNNPESVRRYESILEWERLNHDQLIPLITWAADNLRDHKIVIRPHPAEVVKIWHKRFGDRDNVLIVPRSNPYPWMLGSELVVHTQCTTGLEAALLGKTTLNLKPSRHPLYDHAVSLANPTVSDWETAANAIEQFIRHRKGPIVDQADACTLELNSLFPGYEKGIAARRIAAEMRTLLSANGAPPVELTATDDVMAKYRKVDRQNTLKDKFTITPNEFIERARQVCMCLEFQFQCNIHRLDDSLFVLTPTV